MKTKTVIAFSVMVALATAPAATAGFWEIPGWQAEGVSDNGVVSGGANGYFVWTPGTGALPIGGTPPGNGVGGQGKISNDGTRISGTFLNPVSGFNEMAYFDVGAGTWNPLGGIGGLSGTEISSGWNISGDGNHVVGLGWVNAGEAEATQWSQGVGTFSLGTTNPPNSSRANAVDYDGNVVAGWQDGAGRQGAVWVDGVQELIFDTAGNPAQEALAVSDDGQWVTGLGLGSFFSPATTYRYNTVTDTYETIPNIAVGAESRFAGAGITADGATIVGGTWGFGPATFGKAVIWREGIGTMRFDEYLDSIGVSYPAGYNFAFVSDVSSDGQWFTGWGGPNGTFSDSWVVHIPEPSTLGLLALGAFALCRRSR